MKTAQHEATPIDSPRHKRRGVKDSFDVKPRAPLHLLERLEADSTEFSELADFDAILSGFLFAPLEEKGKKQETAFMPGLFSEELASTLLKQPDLEAQVTLFELLGIYITENLQKPKGRKEREAFVAAISLLVERLNRLADDQGELFLNIAGKLKEWPVMGSTHPDWGKSSKKLLEKLHLGKNVPGLKSHRVRQLIVSGGEEAVKFQIISERLVQLVKAGKWLAKGKIHQEDVPSWVKKATKLPPLTAGSAEEWFEAAWSGVIWLSGGKPHHVPWINDLGEYAREHNFTNSIKNADSRTAAANIRDKAKGRLNRAFLSRYSK